MLGMGLKGQVFMLETFDNGIDTSAGNWTIVNGGNTNDTWFGTVGGYNGQFLNGTEFAFVDSDGAGSGPIYLHEELISPVLNTSSATTLLLEFEHYFRHVTLTDTGWVQAFDGSQWVTLDTFLATTGNFNAPTTEQYDITALSNANLQIRFIYDDDTTWAWHWGVDNVKVFNPPNEDASMASIDGPLGGGRQGTASQLSAAETISIQVTNLGADSLPFLPVSYSINAAAAVQETIFVPIPPNTSATYNFATTANLSAVGSYTLTAWTDLAFDADRSNDTLVTTIRHLPNLPVFLPICQDFDSAAAITLLTNTFAPAGIDEMDFETNSPGSGRLRTASGIGFYNSGNRAITLDRNASGALAVNYAIFTYNLVNYDAFVDQVEMDLSVMDHGDEIHPGDSIWIRGSDALPWIGIIGWNSVTSSNNGQYFDIQNFNLSQPLFAANQNFTTSFQIRIGQEDNFPATPTTASDGFSFDDLCLTLRLDSSAAVIEVISPGENSCGDSVTSVTVVVSNTGSDTLFNIPVTANLTGAATATLTGTVPGPLASGEQDTITLAPTVNTYTGGPLTITAYTQLPGDQFPADDTLTVTRNIEPIPAAPQVTGDTLNCINTIANLAIVNPDTSITYAWYDATGTTVLGTGTSFSAGPITAPISYQVEAGASTPFNIGRPDNAGSGANYLTYSDGLVFTVHSEMIIDSLDVYPNGMGNVVVRIEDGANNLVASVTRPVNPSSLGAKVTIPVGITLQPGNGYRMIATGTTSGGLYRNNLGSAFPYDVPGVATITGTINGLHTSGYYYFFYNWQIRKTGCPGPRTIVQVDTFPFFATQASFTTVQNGLQNTFNATANGQSSWLWDFGDSTSSTLQNPTHTYSQPGTYTVCLVAFGPCDNDTICDTLTVTCAPIQPGFTFSSNGLSVDFMDTTLAATSWAWDFGDGGSSTVANPNHVFGFDATYNVCLFVENICGDTSTVCDSITFCAPLTAGISHIANGVAVDFSDASGGNPVDWLWVFGDGDSSTLPNPTHIYPNTNQSYTVTLIVTNLCGVSDTTTTTVQVMVSLENELSGALSVYPNPSGGVFRVSLGELWTEEVKIEAFDLAGRAVHVQTWAEGGLFEGVIDLSGLAKGTYLLVVEADGQKGFRRIVKQ